MSPHKMELGTVAPLWYSQAIPVPETIGIIPSSATDLFSFSKNIHERLGKILQGRFEVSQGAFRLFSVLDNPNSGAKEIAAAASADPVLASMILKTVNTAAFGMRTPITALGRAIVLLGYNNVKAIALKRTMAKSVATGQDDRLRKIWMHSAMVSTLASRFSRGLPGLDMAEMATMGLLHDMGRILLQPVEQERLAREAGTTGLVIEGLAAASFAETWGLPAKVSQVLSLYGQLGRVPWEQNPKELALSCAVVRYASFVCNWYGFSDGDDELDLDVEILKRVGFKKGATEFIDIETALELDKARVAAEGFLGGE